MPKLRHRLEPVTAARAELGGAVGTRRISALVVRHFIAYPSKPSLLVALLVTVYGLGFGWIAVQRHETLRTNAEDLGFTDQVIWNFLRGQAFRISLYEQAEFETDVDIAALRRPDSLLAFHVEPIIALFAPLYLVTPDVRAILWLQAILMSLGTIPAYRLARRRLRSDWAGAAFAAIYLLAPLGHWALYSDFHTVALAAPLLMLAIDALDDGRLALFFLAGLLATFTKEEVGLLFAGLGALAMLRTESRRIGAVALICGAGWSVLCAGLILPHYSGGTVSPFTARYAHLGAGATGALTTLLRDPAPYFEAMRRPEVLEYASTLLLAGGWLGLLAPELLLPVAPVLALNILSSSPWMASGRAHYSATLLPFLVAAAICGAERLPRLVARAAGSRSTTGHRHDGLLATHIISAVAAIFAVIAYLDAGGGPLSAGFVFPRRESRHDVAAALVARIPRDAPVSASSGLLPHVSQRRGSYLFPTIRDADYVLVDVAGSAFPISPGGMKRRVDELLSAGEFRVVAATDGMMLLEREASATQAFPEEFYRFAMEGESRPRPDVDSLATYADGRLRLLRAELAPSGDIGPRGPLATLSTVWTVDGVLHATVRPSIHIRMRDGSSQHFYDLPVIWWYPPERWRPGERVRIDVPHLPLHQVLDWHVELSAERSSPLSIDDDEPLLASLPQLDVETTPLAANQQPQESPHIDLALGELTARVEREPWRLTLFDPHGRPLWREAIDESEQGLVGPFTYQDAEGDRWRLTRLVDLARESDRARLVVATDEPNGRRAIVEIRSLGPRTIRASFTFSDASWIASVGQIVEVSPDERFLGFGERFDGVDQRGRHVELWARDRRDENFGSTTYAPIPFFISNRGYSLLLETDARARFDVAAANPRRLAWEVDRPEANVVIDYGPSPRDLVQQHARLTGLPPLPPIWAFGVWKTAVGGEQTVLRDAARLRRERIPVSGLLVYDARDDQAHLGWPFVGFAGRQAGEYPDLRRFTDSLHADGFKVLGYKNPDLHVRRSTRPTPLTEDFLIRGADGRPYVHRHHETAWVDFTNPRAVSWWGEQWRRVLGELGFDGGMLDLGELVPADAHYADGTTGVETHNRYLGLYAQSSFEAARAVRGDDFVVFARSASRGAQRFQSLQWPGDQLVTWGRDGIGGLLSAALSIGLSGFPYWHPEVGGFLGVGLPSASERELWFRWLQLGALSPLLRDNYGEHQGQPVEVWSDAETVEAFRSYARLHNSLVPYIYSLAKSASETGLPIMRHLALLTPHDPRAWSEELTYALGDDLLIAPVLEEGARLRTLYLPPGQWVDWWTGQGSDGGRVITAEAPLHRIPIFVRAGAIIPMAPEFDTLAATTQQGVSQWDGDLVLQVAAPALESGPPRPLTPAAFRLYDGTAISTRYAGGDVTLSVESAPRERGYELRLPVTARPTEVRVNGDLASEWGWERGVLTVHVRAESFSITARVADGQ